MKFAQRWPRVRLDAFVRAKYKDNEGNDKTVMSTFCSVGKFKTDEFDAVTGLEVLEVARTSIKYKFNPLSTEQKDGQNVSYYIFANSNAPKKITNPSAEYQVLDELEPGINYTLKIIVTNKYLSSSYDLKDYKNFAETEAATESGLSKPTNIVVTEEAGALDTQPLLKVTWDRIAEDLDDENPDNDIAYEVEYKILKKSSFSKFIHEVEGSYVNAYINTYEATMPVNAGNRYIVRVVAYYVDEPNCKEYSNVVEKQLSKYDDRSLVTALTYPAAVGNHAAGDVIDFTDSNVWDGENFIPRSSRESGYNFGITQFMGEASNDRIRIPTGNPEYFAFKISLDSEEDEDAQGINSTYIPRLIFIDEYAFFTDADRQPYGQLGKVFIVSPDNDGAIMKEFPEGSAYFSSSVNMPYFNRDSNGNLTSTTSAASAGIPINETWIYNNSVYIGVKQIVAGNIGFSYFY